jgi:hypothetical protein
MALKDLIGTIVDGYRLDTLVDSSVTEWRFAGQSVLSGIPVNIRMPRVSQEEICADLGALYQRELDASQILQSTGMVVAARDLIEIHDRPALVTDCPRGKSLADLFVQSSTGQPLSEALPWFRSLVIAFESAHRDGVAHGSFGPADIFKDEDGRLTIRGFAIADTNQSRTDAQRADVRSLAGILYQATTGRAPEAGFPHAGEATPANQIIPDYPESLSRFLTLRLGGDLTDPVSNAGIFRRSLDAMSEYAEVKRKAELTSPTRSPEVVFETNSKRLRELVGPLLSVSLACIAGASAAWLYLQSNPPEITKRITNSSTTAALPKTATETAVHATQIDLRKKERLAIWNCIHSEFATGGDGELSPKELMRCIQIAPDLTMDELQLEALRIVATLDEKPTAIDTAKTQSDSFRRIFLLGADEVEQYVTYRIERQLSLEELDHWIIGYGGKSAIGVLRTLAVRSGAIGIWANKVLTTFPHSNKQANPTQMRP